MNEMIRSVLTLGLWRLGIIPAVKESHMDSIGLSPFRCLGIGLIGFLVAAGCALAQKPGTPPLSANDVSWLFPAPVRAADFDNLISMRDLATRKSRDQKNSDRVWPDAVFKQFLAIAASPAAQAGGNQIGLPAEAQSIDAWYIAGIRMDAGAPGLSDDIRGQFGQSPEIRLIVQPVTRNADGTPKVLDFAAHLIFDFVGKADNPAQTGCLPRPTPDLAAFKEIVAELAALRTKLSKGSLGSRVITSGVPLGLHPGLADASTARKVRQEMQSFLERHVSAERLDAMAIVGIPAGAPAPWMFLSMEKVPAGAVPALPNGGFVPVPGPTLDGQHFAQMLNLVGKVPPVVPAPNTNNLNPITCSNAAAPGGLPVAGRRGSSTTELFVSPPPAAANAKVILDLIADPAKSHFFNTDCVSCHTETRRAMDLLPLNQIAVVSGINPAVLPNSDWNVRNFGWSPVGAQAQSTVTRRTAAETAAVVEYINSKLLPK
jgi:hypothetical protein